MYSIVRFVGIMGTIFFVCAPSTHAATSVSPNITGSWAGSAMGTDYKNQDNGTGGTTPFSEKVAGTATASITQTGNDLIFTVTITASSKGGTPDTFTIPFTGKVGDFAFWSTGAGPDTAQQVFASGHFDKKPSKITGNMIFYRDNNLANFAYTLKKTSSTPTVRAAPVYAFPDAGTRGDNVPVNIVGSSTGKTFDFSTSAKAVTVKSTVNGTINPDNTATITVVTGSNSETFNETEIGGGKGFVETGTGGSDNLLLFGVKTGSGGAGIGWIYNDGGMTEFKWSVTKQ
ncbi:MAG TPA: hypothetical protein VKX17_07745 [Planctomycetota bacterium]|nr:hypothetical protein [Planctomycetota bacterium]